MNIQVILVLVFASYAFCAFCPGNATDSQATPPPVIFNVVNVDSIQWRFTGNVTGRNPRITVREGRTYIFRVNAPGHPFAIARTNDMTTDLTEVKPNGKEVANITWTVRVGTPSKLIYYCHVHPNVMLGNITVLKRTTTDSASDCPAGFNMCGGKCYDPKFATCFPGVCNGYGFPNASKDVLCGKGLIPCGDLCIDPDRYMCDSGCVSEKPENVTCGEVTCQSNEHCCSSPLDNSTACYDPKTSVCSIDPRGFAEPGVPTARICPISDKGKAEAACQEVIGQPTGNITCFDQDTHVCCAASSPGGTVVTIRRIEEGCGDRLNPCPISRT